MAVPLARVRGIASNIGSEAVKGAIIGVIMKSASLLARVKSIYKALYPALKQYARIVIPVMIGAVAIGLSRVPRMPPQVTEFVTASIDAIGGALATFGIEYGLEKRQIGIVVDESNKKLKLEGATTPITVCVDGECKTGISDTEIPVTLESGTSYIVAVDKDGKWDMEVVPYKVTLASTSASSSATGGTSR